MRILVLFTFLIFNSSYNISAQESRVIDTLSNVVIADDTTGEVNSTATSKMYKQDDAYDNKGELLANVSHEHNDRKKKALVRIGIGIVFLTVVIGGWRRRRLAK